MLTLLLSLLTITAQANAGCPRLEGQYRCLEPQTNQRYTLNIVSARQSHISSFYFYNDNGNMIASYVADGRQYTINEPQLQGTTQSQCRQNILYVSTQGQIRDDNGANGRLQLETQILINANNLIIQDRGRIQWQNGQVRTVNETRNCRRR